MMSISEQGLDGSIQHVLLNGVHCLGSLSVCLPDKGNTGRGVKEQIVDGANLRYGCRLIRATVCLEGVVLPPGCVPDELDPVRVEPGQLCLAHHITYQMGIVTDEPQPVRGPVKHQPIPRTTSKAGAAAWASCSSGEMPERPPAS